MIAADSGGALAKARVSLGRTSDTAIAPVEPVYSDANGQFVFEHLQQGHYTLAAEKTGYARTRYGQKNDFDVPAVIAIEGDTLAQELTVRLTKGGAIFGRILDDNGDPVVGGEVSLGAMRIVGTEIKLTPVNRPASQTNDLGEYRIGDLPPGRYFVTVAGAGLGTLPDGVPREWEHLIAWTRTYYPGVQSLSDATPIAIGPGEERGAVDFSITPFQRTHLSLNVSGLLVPGPMDRTSSQLFNETRAVIGQFRGDGSAAFAQQAAGSRTSILTVMLASIDGSGMNTAVLPPLTIVPQASTVTLPAAPILDPGDWIVLARQGPNSAIAHVHLSGGDDASASLELKPGARISGRVLFEGRRPAPPMSDVRIEVQGAGPEAGLPARFLGQGPVTPRADGTFEIASLVGSVELGATAPHGWTLKAVMAAGRDISGDSLTLASGEDVSDVRAVFSDTVANLSGTTEGGGGVPMPGCEVALFPNEPTFHYNARRIRRVRADQNGRFRILDVPSGRYLAVAAPDIDGSIWLSADALDQLRSRATAIALGDREQKIVTLPCASTP